MANSRVKERFELALDAKQVIAVLIGSLVILGGIFVLGVTVGRQQSPAPAPPATITAPKDALARLDEPIAAREEPAPELKAHQALTDARIDKMLPVPQVKTTTVSIAAVPSATVAPPGADPVIQPPTVPAPAPVADAARPAEAAAAAAPATGKASPAVASSVPATKPAPKMAARAKPAPRPVRAELPAKHADPLKHGGYTVQVASVPRRADAERLAKRLSGRNPRIVTADIPGKGRWYRVLVGSYETPDAAKRQAATLTRSGVHGVVTAMR